MSALLPPHFSPSARYLEAMNTLDRLRIFQNLKAYRPTFVGTIPINIDVPDSDIDLICEMNDFSEFENLMQKLFSTYSQFKISTKDLQGPAVHCRFHRESFDIEIVGQNKTIENNRAYRHMIVEAKLLALMQSHQRETIIMLKLAGIKTEPAFCEVLELSGDPYETLDRLADASDEKLKKLVSLSKTPIADV